MHADSKQIDERGLLEELRTSDARFRAICEAAPLGIYVSEIPEGVVYVNPAMQRILGRSQDELLGLGWKKYLHPDDSARALADRATNYDKAAAMRVSARYLRNDGTVIWTMLHAAPIVEDGVLRGYVGMLEDISEHKALQAQLVMAGRLASVGTLAAGVAHEVNTPLAVTLSNLEWVAGRLSTVIGQLKQASELPGGGPHDAVDTKGYAGQLQALTGPLKDAFDAAQRVSVIMKDLTLFSRPEATEQSTANLQRVLASATRMAQHELRHRARVVHDYGELPSVQGSEARLGQVFLNLLINAAHAIPEGRTDDHEIRINARVSEPDMVMVEVRDTGVGVEPNMLERIFDPYFTTKPQNIGTGLGLSICHRIVTDLGGRIEVESEPDRGSVFRVLLRTADAVDSVGPAPEQPLEVTPRRGRLLVIDDDEQLLRSMSMLLGDDNDVDATASAAAALARLKAGESYDAILCDLMMPDMDGMQFHAELSQVLPQLADQVIFLTGGAVNNSVRDFVQRVPNVCIDKPFDFEALKALLAERIGRQEA